MDRLHSLQSGRIIPKGFEVQNGRDIEQVHKVDGSSQNDENLKSKWRDIEQVHKVDRSSQEDESLTSKMDGYKTSPQSGRIIPRG